MRLVLANLRFTERGGSQTYLLTLATELQRLGHDVVIHSPESAHGLDIAASAGIAATDEIEHLPDDVDAVISQDAIVAWSLAERYPRPPHLFVAHSSVVDLQLPPQYPGSIDAVIVMNDRVGRRIATTANPPPRVERLRQPVDLELFRPPSPLSPRPRRMLAIGNNAAGQRRAALRKACDAAGVELIERGTSSQPESDPASLMGTVDIVTGYGRCIVEAMMAGRAAYVFDHGGGDGWVTPETYEVLESDGFMGRAFEEPIDLDRLRADLDTYDPDMGLRNRDLAIRNHDAASHASHVVELISALTQQSEHSSSPPGPDATVIDEYKRLARLAWTWEAKAVNLQRQLSAAGGEIIELREALERTEKALFATQTSLDSAEAEVAEMRHDRDQFVSTGTYRSAALVSRTLQRLRRSDEPTPDV